jgi:hypothetical protein
VTTVTYSTAPCTGDNIMTSATTSKQLAGIARERAEQPVRGGALVLLRRLEREAKTPQETP